MLYTNTFVLDELKMSRLFTEDFDQSSSMKSHDPLLQQIKKSTRERINSFPFKPSSPFDCAEQYNAHIRKPYLLESRKCLGEYMKGPARSPKVIKEIFSLDLTLYLEFRARCVAANRLEDFAEQQQVLASFHPVFRALIDQKEIAVTDEFFRLQNQVLLLVDSLLNLFHQIIVYERLLNPSLPSQEVRPLEECKFYSSLNELLSTKLLARLDKEVQSLEVIKHKAEFNWVFTLGLIVKDLVLSPISGLTNLMGNNWKAQALHKLTQFTSQHGHVAMAVKYLKEMRLINEQLSLGLRSLYRQCTAVTLLALISEVELDTAESFLHMISQTEFDYNSTDSIDQILGRCDFFIFRKAKGEDADGFLLVDLVNIAIPNELEMANSSLLAPKPK